MDIDAQLSKEVVTDQGATLLKKKEENTKEQAHLENYFNSWKNIGSTLKIPPEMQRMFDQAPKIIDGFDKLSNSSFGQDPSSYANVFVGVFAMATQMAQGSDNTPSPWNGLFDALRTISGQIERMQQLMVLNFKMLNLNLDDRFAQLDSLTQAIADAQKGQTQELSHITNQLSQIQQDALLLAQAAANQQNQETELKCLSLVPPSGGSKTEVSVFSSQITDCLHHSFLLSTLWCQNELSVEGLEVILTNSLIFSDSRS